MESTTDTTSVVDCSLIPTKANSQSTPLRLIIASDGPTYATWARKVAQYTLLEGPAMRAGSKVKASVALTEAWILHTMAKNLQMDHHEFSISSLIHKPSYNLCLIMSWRNWENTAISWGILNTMMQGVHHQQMSFEDCC